MKPRLRSRFERDSAGDADKLTQITYPSTATNTFTYNGLDTRVGKVDSAGTATYKRDGDSVTAPVLDDGAAKFTPGISERRGTTSRFTHPDRMGSVTRQTSASQGSSASRQYDAFGNVAAVSGTWTGPFGFAGNWGYQEDGDSGLQLLGHRYYDPSTGRFLTRDPIKDGRNWYTYCENNPLTAVDPEGLQVYGGFGASPGSQSFFIRPDGTLVFPAGGCGCGRGFGTSLGGSLGLGFGSGLNSGGGNGVGSLGDLAGLGVTYDGTNSGFGGGWGGNGAPGHGLGGFGCGGRGGRGGFLLPPITYFKRNARLLQAEYTLTSNFSIIIGIEPKPTVKGVWPDLKKAELKVQFRF
ncbi:MAG: RHS repeat-associated core domain-containing protein [Fimbriimonadaceae bacterium]|nr:RHS repeat-associated core domain-containing protein [Fimbriimonadaceae bacterium]